MHAWIFIGGFQASICLFHFYNLLYILMKDNPTSCTGGLAIVMSHITTLLIGCVLPTLPIAFVPVILISHQLVICRGRSLVADHWLRGWGGEDYWGLLGLILEWYKLLDVVVHMVGAVRLRSCVLGGWCWIPVWRVIVRFG